jgi:hypothetical protein
MTNFFKKIASGANKLFHKADKATSIFFNKTLPNGANTANNFISNVVNTASKVGGAVTNVLEKAAPAITALGVATGQPEIAAFGASVAATASKGKSIINQTKQGATLLKSNISDISSGLTNNFNQQGGLQGIVHKGLVSGGIVPSGPAFVSQIPAD